MLCLCDVAENVVPDGVQGLASVSGKRSATGVPTDDNGMTFARTPGQVSSSCMRMIIHALRVHVATACPIGISVSCPILRPVVPLPCYLRLKSHTAGRGFYV